MYDNELYHYGVLGMKWGVRRYQNEDGTWTNRGKSRRRSNEPHRKKKLTAEQKEKLKKAAKYAAIGAGVAGAAVGGYFLGKKLGPKAIAALRNSVKTYNMPYEQAVKLGKSNYDTIDAFETMRSRYPKNSADYKRYTNFIKNARKESGTLARTSIKTGIRQATNKMIRLPNDVANFRLSPEGQAAKANLFKENYDKYSKAITGVGAALAAGGTAYLGAAAADRLFDENRDKRIARRMGIKYVKKPMNARASDYMFPNPNRKK